MIPFLIIFGCFVLFVLLVKSVLSPTPQPKKQSKPTLTYSPHTIRDLPKQKTEPEKKTRKPSVRYMNVPDDLDDGLFETKIAGVNFHCDYNDIGLIEGFVFNEKENEYDSKAMAVYLEDEERIVGYIPKEDLGAYNKWIKRRTCPFVGIISTFTNDEGNESLFGRITIIKPCNEDFVDDMKDDLYNDYQDELTEKEFD